jgi:malonate transporter and related proteins
LLLLIGAILKRCNITGETFLKTSDRIVYYIFFPALLFWKIGSAKSPVDMDMGYCLAALCAVLTMFLISILAIRLLHVSDYGAGSFSQSCYRFNTYIGMAVIMNALDDEGVRYFGILISFIIPFINVLSITILIWFSGKRFEFKQRVIMMGKALLSNPLILACIAGILYAKSINHFPVFIDNTLRLMTSVTLPLALLSIGSALTFKVLSGHFKTALIASLIKLIILPATGFFLLKAFQVTGTPFRVGMIFFALPTSTSIYILSSQLNSDTELASASIMMSTILSFFSLTIALMI